MTGGTGTTTLLFTDLAGSTDLIERLGDEVAEEVRQRHFSTLRSAVQAHGGEEIKSLGDGLMVAFASALPALDCAATMQRRMAEETVTPPLGLRIGINAGEAINVDDDYFGTPVVIAKRLCDIAEPGQIVVSGVVRSLVGSRGGHHFLEVGPVQLKGFADPVPAYRLQWRAHADGSEPANVTRIERGVGAGDASKGPMLPRSLASENRTQLAGRAEHLGLLQQELNDARGGALRIALLEGESGIGKTRVAAAFATLAADAGVQVLFGRSDPEPLAPFQPFVEAFTDYVERTPLERVRRDLGPNASVLARIVPRLAQRLPDAVSQAGADPDVERYRLLDAAASLLRSLAQRAPLLLVLDDLQWADRSTIALLRHFARSLSESPILLIGTYQGNDLRRDNGLTEFIAERHRGLPLRVIPLQGLSRDDTGALATMLAGRPLPSALQAGLWRETEGHPFFIGEVLRHLLESGELYERSGRLETATAVEQLALPASVRDVVEQRVARLDDDVRDVLRVAAVAGREFDVALLEQVLESSDDRLLRVLDVATAARVIGPVPDALDRYRFLHAMVRQTLYQAMAPARRVRLHQRIAEALERLNPADRMMPHAELAEHYFGAAAGSELVAKAIEHTIAAGRQAVAQLAFEEAAAHFERALKALSMDSKAPSGSTRCEVLLDLADCRWALGAYGRSRETFAEAAELARSLRMPTAMARAALGFGGGIYFGAGLIDQRSIELFEEALAVIGDGDGPLRARVLAHLADALTLAAPYERRDALASEAEAMARRLGDDEILADVLSRGMWSMGTPDNIDARLAATAELDAITAHLGGPILRVEAMLWLSTTHVEHGNIQVARRLRSTLDDLVAHARQPYLEWLAWTHRVHVAMLDRPAAELEPLVWQGLELGQAAQNASSVAAFGAHLLYLRYLQGRFPESHAVALAFADHFAAVPALRLAYAFVCAEIGLHEEARRVIGEYTRDGLQSIPRDVFRLTCLDLLAHISGSLEDKALATTVYELYHPFAERVVIVGAIGPPIGSAHHDLGILATVLGDYDAAERHFTSAMEWEGPDGVPHGRMHTSHYFADMLVRRGDPGDRERAHALVAETLPLAEAAGFGGIVAKLRQVQRRIRSERTPQTPRPASRYRAANAKALVTRRGRDAVAKLVAGKSNDDLERRFGSAIAQRVLFTTMAQGFQPRMAFGFNGSIQVHLGTQGTRAPASWALVIEGQRASARHESVADPALTISTDVATFMRIFAGEVNPLTAFLDGLVQLQGDVTLGPRLPELFGGVKPFRVEETQ